MSCDAVFYSVIYTQTLYTTYAIVFNGENMTTKKGNWNKDYVFRNLSDEGKIKHFLLMVSDKFYMVSHDDMLEFLNTYNIPISALHNLIKNGEVYSPRAEYYRLT